IQKAIHPSPLNRMCWAVRLLTIVVAIALGSAVGWTQSTQGSILGTVKDAKGAVIQGALVTLTNTDAGVVRTTTTSGSGDYQFLDAIAAHYDVEVAAPGFENWKINGAQLAVRQQL